MISLGKRYERLKKIPEELGIQSYSLLVPKQAPSQSSGRKRMHMELEPEIKVPGLDCDRSLPKGVPFVNNMIRPEMKSCLRGTLTKRASSLQISRKCNPDQ
ncbi:hypothetical protein Tco_1093396 [Tanacetum coccineum]|uniref:Uncharacterized protein n=1 Tax=Tanacetum coccineum TaxID=301880 RepID=A0ABQ5ICK0_9ASTR